jgi:methyl-accepting chemotaxis protein
MKVGMMYRRKQYIVDKKLQYRLVIYNVLYFLAIVLAIGFGLFFPLMLDLSNPNLSIAEQGQVADKILYLHSRMGPVLLVLLIALSFHSIFVSHKIAGPLYRFKATFQQVAEGDLSKIGKIRKGDFLVNEQAKIEEMIVALRSKLNNIKREYSAMEQAHNQLIRIIGESGNEELKSGMIQIEACGQRLKKELEYFRLVETGVVGIEEGAISKPPTL